MTEVSVHLSASVFFMIILLVLVRALNLPLQPAACDGCSKQRNQFINFRSFTHIGGFREIRDL